MLPSLIFKKQDRGEFDEIILFLSRELGWLRGLAKNAKRSRIRFGGHLEPFSLVDLVIRSRKKDSLVWIDEAQVLEGFLGIRSDVKKVANLAYFHELSYLFTLENQPEPSLYDFLLDTTAELNTGNPGELGLLLKEIELLGILGYEPTFNSCVVCNEALPKNAETFFSAAMGGTVHSECFSRNNEPDLVVSPDTLAVIRKGLEAGRTASRLKLNPKGLHEIRAFMSHFVRFLRGRDVNSLSFLEKLETFQ
jgi:DNA repair protein RecO (recombination protein O)